MTGYEIVFFGRLVEGFTAEQVRANLCQLFKTDAERIEALFSGQRRVLKSALSEEMAEKYRAALAKAGAVVEVVPPAAAAPAEQPAPDKSATADNYNEAFNHIKAPDFSVAPVGSQMQDEVKTTPAPKIDLSQLSLAPLGSDMGEIKRTEETIKLPDTSHIRLE